MPPSNGGTTTSLGLALFPIITNPITSNAFFKFDPTNFNDPLTQSFYLFKTEDIICGRVGTINRVILSVRNLGVATITLTLSGIDDNTKEPVSNSVVMTIGTFSASGRIITYAKIGLSLTGQNLDLMITRAANGGPVSITKVRMEGKVETTTY
jgi:hypothetical protein